MTIEAPAGSRVLMPQPGAQLGEFIIRDYSFPDLEQEQEAGAGERIKDWLERLVGQTPAPQVQRFHFTITAYDTGDLVIPPMPFAIVDPAGQSHAFYTESARVRVVPYTTPEDLTIKDIKAPLVFPLPWRRFAPYALIPLGIAALVAAVISFARQRRKREEEASAPRPAHELALEALAELEAKNLLAAGEIEQYYTRLSYILRKYLAMRFLFYALEYTTAETLEALKRKDLSHADFERVRGLLAEADLVKFARFQPGIEDRGSALLRAREIVRNTMEKPELSPAQVVEAA
jgi:hypothetical protein